FAPTGSGKTLAAFLWAIDSLGGRPAESPGVRVIYVSPLRALAVDIEKNLRSPIRGVSMAAARLGLPFTEPSVGVRTGDTTASERRSLVRNPPDILITTPESLYLMLTSAARKTLLGVESVIIDEIHALAPTKRGAHLSLTLERLDYLIASQGGASEEGVSRGSASQDDSDPDSARPRPQRIGLSATQRPLEVVAKFLGGDSRVTIIDAGMRKTLDIEVVVPVEDMGADGGSIWPHIDPELLRLVEEHRSTLIFVNARRMAERLAGRLNDLEEDAHSATIAAEVSAADSGPELGLNEVNGTRANSELGEAVDEITDGTAGHELVMAHHGSLSRERRLIVEDRLKRGELRGLVATSSLELGIDMGAVDLVIQVESPGSVASGLQRIGRAGHQVGAPSRGRIFPKHRADLLEAAVVAQRMRDGLIEHTAVLINPLDVLAQQIVACCALDEWTVADLYGMCRRSANFSSLSQELFDNTLDMLAGRYPAEEFAELRPRVVWDRLAGTVRGRAGAQRLAVTSGGTIPDRGLFGVFLPDGTRVGELDEEMVYESRVGETFLLGASTWRIEEITFERVVVTPAPGMPGKMPFWRGDGPGREAELGRALGEFIRTIRGLKAPDAVERLRTTNFLDESAAKNVIGYLDEQAASTGAVPDDRTLVVERFRDEIGDWRICIHSPYGARVHAPWATIIRSRADEHFAHLGEGSAEVMWSDDGIVLRLPEAAENLPLDVIVPDPEEMESELIAALPGTSAFAARFREAAARALLLPRRRPDQRTPLWQQRQRAADLLAVAAKYPSFPILLEATRECCNDVFDLPALRQVLSEVRSRRIRVVEVETATASPFARSLLFGWIAVFMYEGDAPLAERRAAALSLDKELLRDLLGDDELRSLLDPEVVDLVEQELQRLVPDRRARDADEVHDLLRVLGPLSFDEIVERATPKTADGPNQVELWLDSLVDARRVIAVAIAGVDRFAAAEDAGRLRDALGVAIPLGLPAVFTEPVEGALGQLLERFARARGPFTVAQAASRFGISIEVAGLALGALVDSSKLAAGEFRPGGRESEFCDSEVLRKLRRRSLAALRKEVEPVDAAALTRFMTRWQGVGAGTRGVDALVEVLGRLQGAAIAASTLESDVLGVRMGQYEPADLDMLCSSGEVLWIGAGGVGAHDGRIRLVFRDQLSMIVSRPKPDEELEFDDPHHRVIREHLRSRGASFWADIVASVSAASLPYDEPTVLEALWDLAWAGEVTNDSISPLRARIAGSGSKRGAQSRGAAGRNAANRGGSGRGSRRPVRLSRMGPPSGAGRWSLLEPLFDKQVSQTEIATQRAIQFLERYGVLTREMALAEGVEGGFAGVYPVLKAMEERGTVRRGYFVEGLGAAQFAQPGAVDLLRDSGSDSLASSRELRTRRKKSSGRVGVVLAATDTAQPYGAALPWPDSLGYPSRSIGAHVVLVDGAACAYLERAGKKLLTFPEAAEHPEWPAALASLIDDGRLRRMQIATIDDEPAAKSRWASSFAELGFVEGYRGLVKG
ncbi:MAG TPA: DEAD/DEAH box helicase, partial [Microthrixaceae bacterium]|nr:DEAD/DEAH box helicase [Microthrixaceae bacterium]